MALISLACYSTPENKKDECLNKTLHSLTETVDFTKHRLMLSVNGATDETRRIINYHKDIISHVFWNDTNLGTAEAINLIWRERRMDENVIKMDDDVVIHRKNWIELLEECLALDEKIGIIGLKRKDCVETTWHEDPYYRSKLRMLPHTPGHRWCIVEEVAHVMGTCQMYSHKLINNGFGYLFQPKKYGWDDCLASARSIGLGFTNVFYSHIEIDHIDEGQTPFQGWKESHAWQDVELVSKMINEYKSGQRDCYYNPFETK